MPSGPSGCSPTAMETILFSQHGSFEKGRCLQIVVRRRDRFSPSDARVYLPRAWRTSCYEDPFARTRSKSELACGRTSPRSRSPTNCAPETVNTRLFPAGVFSQFQSGRKLHRKREQRSPLEFCSCCTAMRNVLPRIWGVPVGVLILNHLHSSFEISQPLDERKNLTVRYFAVRCFGAHDSVAHRPWRG